MRTLGQIDSDTTRLQVGTFSVVTQDSDLQGITWVLDGLQSNATASTHILFRYDDLISAWKETVFFLKFRHSF